MTDEGDKRRHINPETLAAIAAAIEHNQKRQKETMDRIAPQLEAAASWAQKLAADLPDVRDVHIPAYVPGRDSIAANALLDLIEVERRQSTSMSEVAGSLRDLSSIAKDESNRSKWTLRLLVAATALSLATLVVALVHY